MEIFAVKPPRGRIVHLHSPGYQPSSSRERPLRDREAMCGVAIWPNGTPPMEHSLVPLTIALRWTSLAPSETDPRPVWAWCRPCIGHVVTAYGMQHEVLTALSVRGGES
jgi:hypothetical protein